jgi:hypothetical protein
MSRRRPRWLPLLWATAAALVLAGVVLWGYGRFGGTTATSAQPYEWDGNGPLHIAYQNGAFQGAARCDVQPASGDARVFERTRRVSEAAVAVTAAEPWFSGPATVTCHRAKILHPAVGPYVSLWSTGPLLAVGLAAVGGAVTRRTRRRHPQAGPTGPHVGSSRVAGTGSGNTVSPTAPGTTSGIAVTSSGLLRGGLLLHLSRPQVSIDGVEHDGQWGRQEFPAAPGHHRVRVYVPYLLPRRRGPAECEVTVAPDEVLELEYCVPIWGFLPGSLGPPPQTHRGAGITVLAFAGGVVLLCVLMSLLALTSG